MRLGMRVDNEAECFLCGWKGKSDTEKSKSRTKLTAHDKMVKHLSERHCRVMISCDERKRQDTIHALYSGPTWKNDLAG